MRGQEVLNCRRRKDNQSLALIWLHTLKKSIKNKNNQVAGIITYLSILTLNVNALKSPIKRHHLANWIKRKI
jgi:hypothetical protein